MLFQEAQLGRAADRRQEQEEAGLWLGQRHDAPEAHLASQHHELGSVYIQATREALDGKWAGGGAVWWGVKKERIDIVSISDKVPTETKERVEAVKKGLANGSFVIWRGPIVDNTGKEQLSATTIADDNIPGRHQFLRQGRGRQGAGRRVSLPRTVCARHTGAGQNPTPPWALPAAFYGCAPQRGAHRMQASSPAPRRPIGRHEAGPAPTFGVQRRFSPPHSTPLTAPRVRA